MYVVAGVNPIVRLQVSRLNVIVAIYVVAGVNPIVRLQVSRLNVIVAIYLVAGVNPIATRRKGIFEFSK